MQVDVAFARVTHEIALAFLRHAALERPHHALGQRARAVGNDAAPIEADDAAESAALGTRTERMVEAEESGRGWTDVEVAPRAVPACGERFFFARGGIDDKDASFAEAQRGFDRFGETRLLARGHAVLQNMHDGRERLELRRFIGADDLPADPHAEIALLVEELEKLRRRAFFHIARADRKHDEQLPVGLTRRNLAHDAARGFGLDRTVALGARGVDEARKEKFQIVVDLGDRADGRARGFDIVRLLDGDGGGDALDEIDARLVHAVEKLPRVGRECLDVAALSLGVDCVEGERRFARAARAGDDMEESARQIEVDTAQVVLPRATDAEGVLFDAGKLTR